MKTKRLVANKTYRRGWLGQRLAAIEPEFSSGDPKGRDEGKRINFISVPTVRDRLGINERTLRNWIARPDFVKAQIAFKLDNGRVFLSKERLRLWLVATGAIPATTMINGELCDHARIVASNPPLTKSQRKRAIQAQAREELGL